MHFYFCLPVLGIPSPFQVRKKCWPSKIVCIIYHDPTPPPTLRPELYDRNLSKGSMFAPALPLPLIYDRSLSYLVWNWHICLALVMHRAQVNSFVVSLWNIICHSSIKCDIFFLPGSHFPQQRFELSQLWWAVKCMVTLLRFSIFILLYKNSIIYML